MTGTYLVKGTWEVGNNLMLTGNRIDASGGGGSLTGVGTPGYVAMWSSPTNLATSSLYDSGADPRGVILTLGTLTTPDSTAANGVDLTLRSGAGGTAGSGGDVTIAGGTAGVPGYGGGDVYIRAGYGNGGAYGGGIIGIAGAGSYTAGNGGGVVQWIGGTNTGAGKGGGVSLLAGASTEGDGGDITIGGGSGSTASGTGAGGAVTIAAGTDIADGTHNGNVTIVVVKGATDGGFLIINGLPTSGAGLPSNACFWDSITNVLTRVP